MQEALREEIQLCKSLILKEVSFMPTIPTAFAFLFEYARIEKFFTGHYMCEARNTQAAPVGQLSVSNVFPWFPTTKKCDEYIILKMSNNVNTSKNHYIDGLPIN